MKYQEWALNAPFIFLYPISISLALFTTALNSVDQIMNAVFFKAHHVSKSIKCKLWKILENVLVPKNLAKNSNAKKSPFSNVLLLLVCWHLWIGQVGRYAEMNE